MTRQLRLMCYCLAVGAFGWALLLQQLPQDTGWQGILFAILLAVAIESVGFRVPPSDPHSLAGIVVVGAALALGYRAGALVAASAGLLYGILLPLIYRRPPTFYILVARPLLRSGARALAVLLPALLVAQLVGGEPSQLVLFLGLLIGYPLVVQLARAGREFLQGGRSGLSTWWQASRVPIAAAEVAPLPMALLGAQITVQLGPGSIGLSALALLATSVSLRQATANLRRQRTSMRELAMLNEASRAIVRSELDVAMLCDLIYREASKVVDTGSFHLGLFDAGSDTYTLMVRVQDRMHQSPLTVELPMGDGIVGWMRQTGQSLLVEDFMREMDQLPARPRYQSENPPRSGIYVPLFDGERVIGSMSIQSYRPAAFDSNDLRLLSLIADQAAVSITRARTFTEARQRAVQLLAIQEVSERITAILDPDELLASVVELVRERFGYQHVRVYLVDGAQLTLGAATDDAPAHVVADAANIVQRAASQGIAQVEDDRPGDVAHIAVPFRFGDQLIGVLDVQSTAQGTFAQTDLFVLQTLADQLAVAIESARAFAAQREEAWTLNLLFQVAANIDRAGSFREVADTGVRLATLFLGCDRCRILRWDAQREVFVLTTIFGVTLAERARMDGSRVPPDTVPLLAEALASTTPVVLDLSKQSSRTPLLPAIGAMSLLVALPMRGRTTVIGVMLLEFDPPLRAPDARDLTLAMGVVTQVASALENVLLTAEAAEAAQLEEEIRVAREIQTGLLPLSIPTPPGWQLAADWRSARIVGGDFYDFWVLPPLPGADAGRLGFVIADVSDKGVAAAMFMALSRSLVRAAALDGSPPELALERANNWISRDSESGMFVTIFYGIIDLFSGVMRYCCAGHNPPLLFRAEGEVIELKTPGIALGVLEDVTLHAATVALHHGDLLVCYTDGVTELIDSDEAQFGVPRLIELVHGCGTAGPETVVHAITDALAEFGGGALFDDVTMVVIRRLAATEPQLP